MSFAKYPVSGGAGSSTVTGPATSTNNGVVLFNGTTGNVIKDLGVGTANQVLVTDGTTPSFSLIGTSNIASPNQLVTNGTQTWDGAKQLTGATQLGPTPALTGNLRQVINTGLQGATAVFNASEAGSIQFANTTGTATNPIMIGTSNSTGSSGFGLGIYSLTNDGNTVGDMVFDARENDNTVHATTTNLAFSFRYFNTPFLRIRRDSLITLGSDTFTGTHVFNGGLSATQPVTLSAASNQLVLSSGTNQLTLNSGTSGAARTYEIPNVGATATFMMLEGQQTVAGTKIFSQPITIQQAGNQLVLGSSTTTTINATTPAANRIYTIPDAGAAANFIMSESTQTINGSKTLTSALTLNAASNQLVLSSGTNQLTINSGTSTATRIYTVPDVGSPAQFVMTAGTQSIAGSKTLTSALTINAASNQLILSSGLNQLILNSGTSALARTYAIPDVGASGTFAMLEGAQTFTALKTFNSGLTLGGGSAANLSIWSASNILNLRGGTSGLDIYNTSGVVTVDVTDAGAVTLGPAAFTGEQTFNGNTHLFQADGTNNASIIVRTGGAARIQQLVFRDQSTDRWVLRNRSDDTNKLQLLSAGTQVLEASSGGAWTLGPSAGGVNHTVWLGESGATVGRELQLKSAGPLGTAGYNVITVFDGTTNERCSIGITKRTAIASAAGFINLRTTNGTSRFFYVDTSGNLRYSGISDDVGTANGTFIGGPSSSGRYTPTIAGVTNIGTLGTAQSSMYSRVGDVVTVSIRINGVITSAGAPTLSRISVSLPIASNFGTFSDASGSGAFLRGSATINSNPVFVAGRAASDDVELLWNSSTTSAGDIIATFQYEVI